MEVEESPLDHESDSNHGSEIEVTPQKSKKKLKGVVEDMEKILDDFFRETQRKFEQSLLIERSLMAEVIEQQRLLEGLPPGGVITPPLEAPLSRVVENSPPENAVEVIATPQAESAEAGNEIEVTPPIFGLQEGEQLGEHLANILAVKTPKSSLMLQMVAILPGPLRIPLRVLLDTGCEMCLVRSGLIP